MKKTVGLRIFKDDDDNMNLSIQDVGGEALVVSQFTLCADTSRGKRPSFIYAESQEKADHMYQQYCEQLNLPIIKVFRVGAGFDESKLFDYNVSAFLFDTYNKGLPGGTGVHFDWGLISNIKRETPIILSGGLTASNVLNGVKVVKPSAVDVNSGVEDCPGEKNREKLIKLNNSSFSITEDLFHSFAASQAASIALLTSSSVDLATFVKLFPSTGEILSKYSPFTGAVHFPPIKLS